MSVTMEMDAERGVHWNIFLKIQAIFSNNPKK